MSTSLTTGRLAKRAESIETRADLQRWEMRCRSRFRFLLVAYLIGVLPLPAIALYFTIQSAISGYTISLNGLVFSMVPGICCFGPIVLLPCAVLLSSGLSNYRQAIAQLKVEHRVCDVCEAVALYEDMYVNPSQKKGHTLADLVPHMHVIEEQGEVNVLCESCFAEVHAIDSEQ